MIRPEEDINRMFDEKITPVNDELANIKKELELSRQENNDLKKEIIELKDLIKGIDSVSIHEYF